MLVARDSLDKKGFFICTDGSSRSMQAVRRAAVLAEVTGEPITLFSVADSPAGKPAAEEAVANAKALLKAMKIQVAETRVAVGKASRGNRRERFALQGHRGHRRRPLAARSACIRGSTATEVVRKARTSVLDVR